MFTMRFLDGTTMVTDDLKQVEGFISEMAAFEESLTPEERDEMEREIERKRNNG